MFKKWISLRENNEEEMAFIQAIKQTPEDRTTWLVYADWLDDHGRPEEAAVIRKAKATAPPKSRQVNSMGEREYQSFGTWRKAIMTEFPGVTFEGNKDIAQALFHGTGVGEWDGERGVIYAKAS